MCLNYVMTKRKKKRQKKKKKEKKKKKTFSKIKFVLIKTV